VAVTALLLEMGAQMAATALLLEMGAYIAVMKKI
jgi:hypothetical protein